MLLKIGLRFVFLYQSCENWSSSFNSRPRPVLNLGSFLGFINIYWNFCVVKLFQALFYLTKLYVKYERFKIKFIKPINYALISDDLLGSISIIMINHQKSSCVLLPSYYAGPSLGKSWCWWPVSRAWLRSTSRLYYHILWLLQLLFFVKF